MSNYANTLLLEELNEVLEKQGAGITDIDEMESGELVVPPDYILPVNIAELLKAVRCGKCYGKGGTDENYEVEGSAREHTTPCDACGGKGYFI